MSLEAKDSCIYSDWLECESWKKQGRKLAFNFSNTVYPER